MISRESEPFQDVVVSNQDVVVSNLVKGLLNHKKINPGANHGDQDLRVRCTDLMVGVSEDNLQLMKVVVTGRGPNESYLVKYSIRNTGRGLKRTLVSIEKLK